MPQTLGGAQRLVGAHVVSGAKNPVRNEVITPGLAEDQFESPVARDLTEESLRRTQFSIDHAADLVYWVDNEGRVVDASLSTAKSLGFSRDELLGMTIFELTVGPTREAWPELWEEAKRGSYTVERELRTKDGRTFPVAITVNYVAYEGIEYNCVFAHDVSARRKVEEALRASEGRYRVLVDATSDAIYSYDTAWRVTGINRTAAQQLRLEPEEALGRSLEEIGLPAHTLSQWKRTTAEVLDSRGPVRVVNEMVMPDGESHAYETVLEPVFDGTGELTELRGASRDITEQKRLEQSLHLAQFALERAADLIHWIDPEGRILFANDAGCRRDGYSREEMLSRKLFDLDPTLTPDLWRDAWRRLKEAGSFTVESVHRTKGGELYPVEVSVNYIEQGQKEYCFAFARDITDRKRAGEMLLDSEERLRLALDASNQGTWDLDLRTRQAVVSPHYALMLGYEPEEYHPSLDEFKASLAPEDRERVEAIFRAHIRGEQPAFDAEYRRQTKTGDWRWFRALGKVTERDGEGVPVRIMGTQSDITEPKRVEKALGESEAQLRQAQKMEAVGQLAGGIAHDFNNVLTTIIGYSDVILASDACADDSLRTDMEQIKAAGERAGALTRQILAFSRRQALQPKVLSLNDVLESTELLLRRTLGENINLISLLRTDLGLVEVDEHQIGQVLVNLALNARDAMPGGGRLTLETANVELSSDYCQVHPGTSPGAYVMLAVSDTGTGMSEATRSRVFEPFFTTKEAGKGTGLGLATVYGVVKQSGGNVSVYSEPAKGTTFKIYLPRVDKPATARSGTARLSDSMAGTETILVVEDEPTVRELVRRILERLGYGVVAVGNGDEGLAFLKGADPQVDLLLTDVVLPGSLQGHELARAAAVQWPHLPVLYMSGYTRNAIVHSGQLDEGVNYIEKPFTPANLARRVREVLDCRSPVE